MLSISVGSAVLEDAMVQLSHGVDGKVMGCRSLTPSFNATNSVRTGIKLIKFVGEEDPRLFAFHKILFVCLVNFLNVRFPND